MEGRGTDKPGSDTAELTAAIRAAYEAAVEAVESQPDPQQAFEQATTVADLLRQLADDGAKLRARAVGRIWDSEEMSLATLANRIGVAKSRADQLMRAARNDKREREG